MTTKEHHHIVYSKPDHEPICIPQDDAALMNERAAAAFLDLTQRCLQNFRLNGLGPEFIKISPRCVRYRRRSLISWGESKRKRSTSDQGNEQVPAKKNNALQGLTNGAIKQSKFEGAEQL